MSNCLNYNNINELDALKLNYYNYKFFYLCNCFKFKKIAYFDKGI